MVVGSIPPAQLSSPLVLPNGNTLPNRLLKSALSESMADAFNNVTAPMIKLYQTWLDGGAGLVITGNMMVDRDNLERARNVVIDELVDTETLGRLGKLSRHGQLWVQLSHPGRQVARYINSAPVSASSAPAVNIAGQFAKPHALTAEECEELVGAFTRSAVIAQEAGFDGVQIHCAHGYLLSQFLSPLVNSRDDQFGGDVVRRAELPRRIIQSVREVCGSRFGVGIKINGRDGVDRGFDPDMCLATALILDAAGLDLIEISGGTYETPIMADGGEEAFRACHSVGHKMTSQVKAAVCVTGGLREVKVMEGLVEGKDCDLVGLGRPFCLDPAFPLKVLSGLQLTLPLPKVGVALGGLSPLASVGCYTAMMRTVGDGERPTTNTWPLWSLSRQLLGDVLRQFFRKSPRPSDGCCGCF